MFRPPELSDQTFLFLEKLRHSPSAAEQRAEERARNPPPLPTRLAHLDLRGIIGITEDAGPSKTVYSKPRSLGSLDRFLESDVRPSLQALPSDLPMEQTRPHYQHRAVKQIKGTNRSQADSSKASSRLSPLSMISIATEDMHPDFQEILRQTLRQTAALALEAKELYPDCQITETTLDNKKQSVTDDDNLRILGEAGDWMTTAFVKELRTTAERSRPVRYIEKSDSFATLIPPGLMDESCWELIYESTRLGDAPQKAESRAERASRREARWQ